MEEIKNWWGVFGLLGCVTVVSSSLERRCHRQGSLASPISPASSVLRPAEPHSLFYFDHAWLSASLTFFFLHKVASFAAIPKVCVLPLQSCTSVIHKLIAASVEGARASFVARAQACLGVCGACAHALSSSSPRQVYTWTKRSKFQSGCLNQRSP